MKRKFRISDFEFQIADLRSQIADLRLSLLVVIAAGTLLAPFGCLPHEPRQGMSQLAQKLRPKPLEPGPNGLFMDVLYLERPFGDAQLNGDLWLAADDEVLDMTTRLALERHGFRVAVLGGQLPAILKSIFEEAELNDDRGQHLQMQAGSTTQVQTSGDHAVWPVTAIGNAAAAEYRLAVGVVQMLPRITADGRVSLSVTPEIQHGDERRTFVPNRDGSGPMDWTVKSGRQTRPFHELRITTELRPGQYLMMSCRPDDPDSLAARFFTRTKDGRTVQRVVLIEAEPSRQALAARGKQ